MKDFMEQQLWLNPWHLFISVLNKGGPVKNSLCRILKVKIIPYMSDNPLFIPSSNHFTCQQKKYQMHAGHGKRSVFDVDNVRNSLEPKI